MQETVQEKAPERPAQAGQLKVSTGGAAAPFVDNRPSSAAQLKLAQMANTAPKVVAQRHQMNVIHGGTAQLEEDDEPLQGKMEPVQRAVIDGVEVPDEPEGVQHPVQHPQVPAEAAPPQQGGEPVVGEQNPEMAPEQAAVEQAAVQQGDVPGTPAPVADPNGQQDPNADAVAAAAAMPEQVLGNPQAPEAAAVAEEPVVEQHPVQHPIQEGAQHPMQNPAPPEEETAPVQQKADPAQLQAMDGAQAGPVRQFAFVRTWGDEEPEQTKAPAAPQATTAPAAAPQAPAAAPAPQQKLGFFGRMKQGVKNVAGRVGQWLVNWSGRGKPQGGAANGAAANGGAVAGQQPAAVQAPAGPKVYVKNEKRVGARRIQSRAPVARGAAAAERQKMMMERMKNSAEPTPAPAAAPAAPVAAAPEAASAPSDQAPGA